MSPADAQAKDRERRTVSSALWAAWGDALGFITEFADEAGMRRRLGGQPLREPVAWKRRVGGKFGVEVNLPAGCYSDDTQLRLATGRAVHNHGFDVEAFARVELPIWPAYALGGGKASKAAAASLAKPGTPWFGNTFDGWLDAGGNGVAMRIQPHVWAAPHPGSVGTHLIDVITNGVATHGHPRALVGAVLHAVTLGVTLETGQVPPVESWPELLEMTHQAVKLVDENSQLASLWRPIWESAAGVPLDEAWQHTVDECREMFDSVAPVVEALGRLNNEPLSATTVEAYDALLTRLALREPASRGSGTATVVAAVVLAAALPFDPAASALVAAQALGTDTDTIATMAAGIVGACRGADYPAVILDSSYISTEAIRLAGIASGKPGDPFSYPDLLNWAPPRAQLDAVGLDEGRLALAGLGWLDTIDDSPPTTHRGTTWQWMQSDFGASFLIKRRESPRSLPDGNRPQRRKRSMMPPHVNRKDDYVPDVRYFQPGVICEIQAKTVGHPRSPHTEQGQKAPGDTTSNHNLDNPRSDIDSMLTWVINHGLSDREIGYAVRRLAEVGTIEQMIGFVTALRAEIRHASAQR
jgi:ADP-ribosylglycohydrolase